ncbi:hypothetical protein [Embleya sp. NBC_00896]|uniref:hypothetical protein n=1 Tax=Embleya sp. NBC_00896 TaxID=2975961 RepID=UPI002F90EEB2|nr:hypothetical protein OG928_48285 [Embleya sp. NBC_00896]
MTSNKAAAPAGEPEWMPPADIARRAVDDGFIRSMSAERLYYLAHTDPDWPVPEEEWKDAGTAKLIPWDNRLRGYFERRREPEWLTLTAIAERVVEAGYATTMSRPRVSVIARTDPDWPVPEEEWKGVGRAKLIPWDDRLQKFWSTRQATDGPKGWSRPVRAEKPPTVETVSDTEVAKAFGLPVDLVPDLKPRRGKAWRRDDVNEILRTRPAWFGNEAEARVEVARRLRDRARRRAKHGADG